MQILILQVISLSLNHIDVTLHGSWILQISRLSILAPINQTFAFNQSKNCNFLLDVKKRTRKLQS